MKVGTIAYTSNQGIAYLAWDFYKHGLINTVYPVKHPQYPNESRYSNVTLDKFVQDLDILILFETYLDRRAADAAIKYGAKVILVPMYEYTPNPFPFKVDLCLCPSLLDLEIYKDLYRCEFLPIPVEKEWKLRTIANTFIHNAGHGQYRFAKGTIELLEATKLVSSNIQFIVRAQPCPSMKRVFTEYRHLKNVEFVLDDLPRDDLYKTGDVLVFPEKFNGLSLPLQEAFASGLLVMATDRFPANSWLPNEPLIPVEKTYRDYISGGSRIVFDWSLVNPVTLAKKIDHWYGRDISEFSLKGKQWAEENSWENLIPKYKALFESLLN